MAQPAYNPAKARSTRFLVPPVIVDDVPEHEAREGTLLGAMSSSEWAADVQRLSAELTSLLQRQDTDSHIMQPGSADAAEQLQALSVALQVPLTAYGTRAAKVATPGTGYDIMDDWIRDLRLEMPLASLATDRSVARTAASIAQTESTPRLTCPLASSNNGPPSRPLSRSLTWRRYTSSISCAQSSGRNEVHASVASFGERRSVTRPRAESHRKSPLADLTDLIEAEPPIFIDGSGAGSGAGSGGGPGSSDTCRDPGSAPRARTYHYIDHEAMLSWNGLDVLALAQESQAPLVVVAVSACRALQLFERMPLQEDKVACFATVVEALYRRNPYHNSTHAADVTQALVALVSVPSMQEHFTSADLLAMVLTCVVHDVAHPGVNNKYLEDSMDHAFLMFPKHTAEHMSLTIARFLLSIESCSLLNDLDDADAMYVLSMLAELTLATDMSKHLLVLSKGRDFGERCTTRNGSLSQHSAALSPMNSLPRVASLGASTWASGASKAECSPDVLCLSSLLVHAADLAASSRRPRLAGAWCKAVYEEFYQQADLEADNDLPITAFFQRGVHIARAQLGFVRGFVAPVFDALADISADAVAPALEGLSRNLRMWESLDKSGAPSGAVIGCGPANSDTETVPDVPRLGGHVITDGGVRSGSTLKPLLDVGLLVVDCNDDQQDAAAFLLSRTQTYLPSVGEEMGDCSTSYSADGESRGTSGSDGALTPRSLLGTISSGAPAGTPNALSLADMLALFNEQPGALVRELQQKKASANSRRYAKQSSIAKRSAPIDEEL